MVIVIEGANGIQDVIRFEDEEPEKEENKKREFSDVDILRIMQEYEKQIEEQKAEISCVKKQDEKAEQLEKENEELTLSLDGAEKEIAFLKEQAVRLTEERDKLRTAVRRYERIMRVIDEERTRP